MVTVAGGVTHWPRDGLLLKKKNGLKTYNLHTVIWVAADFRWAFWGELCIFYWVAKKWGCGPFWKADTPKLVF